MKIKKMIRTLLLSFFPSLRETKFVNTIKNNFMCEQNPDDLSRTCFGREKGEKKANQKNYICTLTKKLKAVLYTQNSIEYFVSLTAMPTREDCFKLALQIN